MDPLSIARYGMMTAQNRLTASAQRAVAPDADYGSEAVEQVEARQQFAASAKIAMVADEMWRSLLDIQKA